MADRGLNYGKPEDNFARIARYWNVHLQNRYGEVYAIDAVDVALMMNLMKVARLDNEPRHLDSWIDMAGYAACGANIIAPAPLKMVEGGEPLPKTMPDPVTVHHNLDNKWIKGVEFEWHGKNLGWIATGTHDPDITNTPKRGTPLHAWSNK